MRLPVQVPQRSNTLPTRTMRRLAKHVLKPFRSSREIQLQREISRTVERALVMYQPDFPAIPSLPERYGRGLPERVVELLLARLIYQAGGQLLDVGHANAMACHLNLIKTLPAPRNLTGIDIACPSYDVSGYYQDSVRGDIANTGFGSDQFQIIWCISALEHFGMDNSGYTDRFSRDDELASKALQEMFRIVKPGGRILITVPFGKYEDHGRLINYDSDHWQDLLSGARPYSTIHEWYFRHTFGNGWVLASADELAYVGYYDQANYGAGAIAAVIIEKNG